MVSGDHIFPNAGISCAEIGMPENRCPPPSQVKECCPMTKSIADDKSIAEKTGQPMIVAENLSKFYGPFVAVRDVSFSVPKGQVAAFLGPNGAGKSTTMKLLTGFLSPSDGRAEIGGFAVSTHREEAGKLVGYLPENGPLYNEMTPKSLLKYMGRATGCPRTIWPTVWNTWPRNVA